MQTKAMAFCFLKPNYNCIKLNISVDFYHEMQKEIGSDSYVPKKRLKRIMVT